MDTVKEIKESMYLFSGTTSKIVRQLSFIGIGVVWIFRIGKTGIDLPAEMQLPLFLFVLTLALDLMQNVIQTATWAGYYYIGCAGKEDNEKVDRPKWFVYTPWLFFMVKVLLMGWGYAILTIRLYIILT